MYSSKLHYTGHLSAEELRKRARRRRADFWLTIVFVAAVLGWAARLAGAEEVGRLARVKDISSIEGIRDNQLVGYGLVVGVERDG